MTKKAGILAGQSGAAECRNNPLLARAKGLTINERETIKRSAPDCGCQKHGTRAYLEHLLAYGYDYDTAAYISGHDPRTRHSVVLAVVFILGAAFGGFIGGYASWLLGG